jgi:hypothetical protein
MYLKKCANVVTLKCTKKNYSEKEGTNIYMYVPIRYLLKVPSNLTYASKPISQNLDFVQLNKFILLLLLLLLSMHHETMEIGF